MKCSFSLSRNVENWNFSPFRLTTRTKSNVMVWIKAAAAEGKDKLSYQPHKKINTMVMIPVYVEQKVFTLMCYSTQMMLNHAMACVCVCFCLVFIIGNVNARYNRYKEEDEKIMSVPIIHFELIIIATVATAAIDLCIH